MAAKAKVSKTKQQHMEERKALYLREELEEAKKDDLFIVKLPVTATVVEDDEKRKVEPGTEIRLTAGEVRSLLDRHGGELIGRAKAAQSAEA